MLVNIQIILLDTRFTYLLTKIKIDERKKKKSRKRYLRKKENKTEGRGKNAVYIMIV